MSPNPALSSPALTSSYRPSRTPEVPTSAPAPATVHPATVHPATVHPATVHPASVLARVRLSRAGGASALDEAFALARTELQVGVAGVQITADEAILLAPQNYVSSRESAAGVLYGQLWCRHAPPHWDAVVLRSHGTSERLDDGHHGAVPAERRPVSILVLATRSGTVRAEVSQIDDGPRTAVGRSVAPPHLSSSGATDCTLAPEGQLIDAIRRYLQLPTAEEPRGIADLVVTIWCDRLVAAVLDPARSTESVPETLLCHHPLFASERDGARFADDTVASRAEASTQLDRLVGTTRQLATDTGWERLRLLAAESQHHFAGASSEEAAWADAPMFGRLLLDQYPSLFDLLDTIDAQAPTWLAHQVRTHVAKVFGDGVSAPVAR